MVKLYGYIINDQWLLQYGNENGLAPTAKKDTDIKFSTISNAITKIWATATKAGSKVEWEVAMYKGQTALCMVLATDDPSDAMPVPSPERWEVLKRIFGTERDPRWYPKA